MFRVNHWQRRLRIHALAATMFGRKRTLRARVRWRIVVDLRNKTTDLP
jgi:hypothetical protein